MKTQEHVFPELVERTRDGDDAEGDPLDLGDALVEEVDPAGGTASPTMSAAVRAATTRESESSAGQRDTMKTAEINLDRDRRDTLTSPISALIAQSMVDVSEAPPARDPAAPEPEGNEQTRRVGDSDRQPAARDRSAGYTVEVVNDANSQRRLRAARLIDQARALMESGALAGAVVAAEHALDEGERAVAPGIAEVIEPARPLLAKVFGTFVGPLTEVPVLAKRSEELALMPLDDRKRAVIALVDGVRTLDQILDGARIPASDALRVAASLLRAGVIRVV